MARQRRKSRRRETKRMAGTVRRASDYGSEEQTDLHTNRWDLFQADRAWRKKCVDLDKLAKAADETSDSKVGKRNKPKDDIIPIGNEIRNAANEFKSIALMNLPGVKLKVVGGDVQPDVMDEEVFRLLVQKKRIDERMANRVWKTIAMRNHLTDIMTRIIDDCVDMGFGLIQVGTEQAPSALRSTEVALLMRELDVHGPTPALVGKYERLTSEVSLRSDDVRNWYFQHRVRDVYDPHLMQRVSHHEIYDTAFLRDFYNDDKIFSCSGPLALQREYGRRQHEGQTGIVTMWEIEPFVETVRFRFHMGGGDAKRAMQRIEVVDGRLVETVFDANHVIRQSVKDRQEAVIALPIRTFYLQTARDHPYGYSLTQMLIQFQEFANRLRLLMYKQGLNSISPQAVALLISKLTGKDYEEIKRGIEEGGLVPIDAEEVDSIQEILQPLTYNTAGVNGALLQMLKETKEDMQRLHNSVNQEGFNRIRSAAGKRAHLNAVDRPHTFSVAHMARGVEDLCELSYRWWQWVQDGEEMDYPLLASAETFEIERINEEQMHGVPVMGADGLPLRLPEYIEEGNPEGIAYRKVPIVWNDSSTVMRAIADGRGTLPANLEARLNLIGAWAESELLLSKQTARELALDEEIRALDDANAAADRAEMMKQEQVAQMLQEQQRVLDRGAQSRGLVGAGHSRPDQRADARSTAMGVGF